MKNDKRAAAQRKKAQDDAVATFDALVGTRKFTGRAAMIKEIREAGRPRMAAKRLAKVFHAGKPTKADITPPRTMRQYSSDPRVQQVLRDRRDIIRHRGQVDVRHALLSERLIEGIEDGSWSAEKISTVMSRLADMCYAGDRDLREPLGADA